MPKSTAFRSFYTVPFVERVADKIHDIAVLSITNGNPLAELSRKDQDSWAAAAKASVARLTTERPREGEDVFGCGFPLGESTLITTTGHIASSWDVENLVTARKKGIAQESEVYKLDLRINPGNSGGPIFLTSDEGVIGIVVEVSNSPGSSGGIATGVPAKYIADLLTANRIPFSSAPKLKSAVHK